MQKSIHIHKHKNISHELNLECPSDLPMLPPVWNLPIIPHMDCIKFNEAALCHGLDHHDPRDVHFQHDTLSYNSSPALLAQGPPHPSDWSSRRPGPFGAASPALRRNRRRGARLSSAAPAEPATARFSVSGRLGASSTTHSSQWAPVPSQNSSRIGPIMA